MKSTELSQGLEIEARRIFGDLVVERKPWQNARRRDRAAAFLHCWQVACGVAAWNFKLSDRDDLVLTLQRGIPTRVLEAQVRRDSHP